MDPISFAAGIFPLFKSSMDNFKIVKDALNMRSDLRDDLLVLKGYETRLKDWSKNFNVNKPDLGAPNSNKSQRTTAFMILARINLHLSKCDNRAKLYDLRKNISLQAMQKAAKNDKHIAKYLEEYEHNTCFLRRFFRSMWWAFYHRENFQERIDKIGELLDALSTVLPPPDKKEEILVKLDENISKDILNWISPIIPREIHKHKRSEACLHINNRGVGSSSHIAGQTLLKSLQFQSWLYGSCDRLWYKGSAGVGKTILASSIINAVRDSCMSKNKGCQYAYFYVIYDKKYTRHDILASLCTRFLQPMTNPPVYITNLWKKRGYGRERISPSDIEKLYQALIKNRKTFIVIDALDELDPNEQQELIEILQPKNTNDDFQGTVKLLITSREVEGFPDKAETFATCEVAADDKDIAAFIDHQLEKSKKDNKRIAKLLSENPDLKKTIKSTVLEKASGVFLIAYLQMNWVMSQKSQPGIHKCLEKMPDTLDGMYKTTFDRIQEKARKNQRVDCQNLGLLFISWVFYHFKSHTSKQITKDIALAFTSIMNDAAPSEDPDPPSLNDVVAYSCSILKYGNGLEFFHRTCSDYIAEHQSELMNRMSDHVIQVFNMAFESSDLRLLNDAKFLEFLIARHHTRRRGSNNAMASFEQDLKKLEGSRAFQLAAYITTCHWFPSKKCVYMEEYDASEVSERQDLSDPLYAKKSALHLLVKQSTLALTTPPPPSEPWRKIALTKAHPKITLFFCREQGLYASREGDTASDGSRSLSPLPDLTKGLMPESPLTIAESIFLHASSISKSHKWYLKPPFGELLARLLQTKIMGTIQAMGNLDILLAAKNKGLVNLSLRLNSGAGLYIIIFDMCRVQKPMSMEAWNHLGDMIDKAHVYENGIVEGDLFNFLKACYEGQSTAKYPKLEAIQSLGYLTSDHQSFEIGDMAGLLRGYREMLKSRQAERNKKIGE
ncbi:NACHT domain protein [Ceratocystis lukuohia]|uniref:NACHT domain protein n=1 Tax=Ceratocystis lukuohia TaxID=2019550 RepID=A0ABR4M8N1_9PEZI